MKEFNKSKAKLNIKIKQNKDAYIKKLSISLVCLILLCVIILFTFAKFETSSEEYTLINGKVRNDSCNRSIGQEWTFNYTGSEQNFEVTCDGYYKVELWGAAGGSGYVNYGGDGAYTSGIINLNEQDILYVYVGRKGTNGSSTTNTSPSASYNGGGKGSNSSSSNPSSGSYYSSGSGGGATDVRKMNGAWNNSASLNSRIMVAAGGGGGAYNSSNPGNGGGILGYDSTNSSGSYGGVLKAIGGTQIAGGASSNGTTTTQAASYYTNSYKGSFGQGGNVISTANNGSGYYGDHPGGAGGGGWYGGGAGGSGGASVGGASGGGGSSYISGHTGCVGVTSTTDSTPKSGCTNSTTDTNCSISPYGYTFINTKMIDGAGYEWTTTKAASSTGMPTHDGTSTMTGNSGNGYAKITYLGDNYCPIQEGTTYTFNYTDSAQEFNAPCDGEYKVELWGAQGGNAKYSTQYTGGLGGYTVGNIDLQKNDSLYVYVGGQGVSHSGTSNDTITPNGNGYNGGGVNGRFISGNSNAGGGGGASDVRLVNGTWNDPTSLNSRIMVTGGGGGAASHKSAPSYSGNGGAGGGLNGYDSNKNSSYYSYGSGGSQVAGGSSIASTNCSGCTLQPTHVTGSFGKGGASLHSGGGGGYYGGGAGQHTSAAGGSSYISGHAGSIAIASGSTTEPRAIKSGCTASSTSVECSKHYSGLFFTNTKMIDGQGYEWTTTKAATSTGMPTQDGSSTMTGNTGNGYAKITYLGE